MFGDKFYWNPLNEVSKVGQTEKYFNVGTDLVQLLIYPRHRNRLCEWTSPFSLSKNIRINVLIYYLIGTYSKMVMSYLIDTSIIANMRYFPSKGTTNDVGGMISTTSRKNTWRLINIDIERVTCKKNKISTNPGTVFYDYVMRKRRCYEFDKILSNSCLIL